MADGPLSPEEVAHRGFATSFRGFDTGEVRAYLARVANDLRASTARERELQRRLAEAEHRAANPVLDGETLTRALGAEMARILANAQAAAQELRARAEENTAQILREAHDQAQRIRAQAEVVLADRSEEAEAEAAEIRRTAEAEASALLDRARREAAAAMAEVEAKARVLVQEAQTARARVLGDLVRRRRAVHAQVEQLRAGRERLLDAYRLVRHTLDEVADELERVEVEARQAAAAAGHRVALEPDVDTEDVDALAAFPAPEEGSAPDPVSSVVAGPATGSEPATAEPAAEHEGAPVAPTQVEPPPTGPPPTELPPTGPLIATPPVEATSAEGTGAASPEAPKGGGPAPLRVVPEPGAGDDARPGRLDVVQVPAEIEAVRLLDAAEAATHPAVAAEPEEAGRGAAGPRPGPQEADVDELFARIRAGRAAAVARAEQVLAGETPSPAEEAAPSARTVTPADAVGDDAGHRRPGPAESLLERRDTAVAGIDHRLTRRLKRALQDEQNEVLDRLRSSRGTPTAASVLPSAPEQAARYRQAAEEPLRAAGTAGAAFIASGGGHRPSVEPAVDELVRSLAGALRRDLEEALAATAGEDPAVIVERVSALYREHKVQRIEGLAGDAVTAGFCLGVSAAVPKGALLQWVVDDDGRPCPDCDDNALAGPTPCGEDFPTGQSRPPAHPGCRCLLAPPELPQPATRSG